MTAQGFMEAFQDTEGIVATINRLIWWLDVAFPTGRNDLHGSRRKIGVFVLVLLTQKREGFEQGFARLVALKLDRAQQCWEKPTNHRIASDNFLIVVVICRACQ